MTAPRFDELIHPSTRLAIVALLADIERTLRDHRRRVRARLTPVGREAFHGHVAALAQIVRSADPEHALV
jgi:hypothetical protein